MKKVIFLIIFFFIGLGLFKIFEVHGNPDVLLDKSGNTTSIAKFGGNTTVRQRTASKFTATDNWTLTSVDVRIMEDTGNPTGDVQIGIFTDSGGVPSVTQVGGWATITAADANVGATWTDFNRGLSSSASLNNGTTYWLVFRVASGQDDSNYYASRAAADGANNGAEYTGSWANNTDDLFYKLNGSIGTAAMILFWSTF